MNAIRKRLDLIVEIFCITVLSIMTLLVTWQVFTRYVLNNPSAVTEQLAQYLFVWLVLFGSAYVFGKRDHMAIVFVVDKVSPKVKLLLTIIQELLISMFAMGVMVYGGSIATARQMLQVDAALQIPIGVIYSAVPISGVFVLFYGANNILNMINAFKNVKSKGE